MSDSLGAMGKDTSQDAIEQHAAERLIARLHDSNWTEEKQVDLDAWLSVSVAHEVAYLRLEAGWNQSDKLAVLRRPAQSFASQPKRSQGTTGFHIAAVLFLCAMAGVIGYASLPPGNGQVFATPVGGRETITLTDGSQIELNTNTELRLPQGSRQAKLIRGEAYFEIKHDPKHPFTLETGDHRIVDLGTKFVVRQRAGKLEVTLIEGSARVESSVNAALQPTVLRPGDMAIATSDHLTVIRKSVVTLSDALSWRSGFVIFHHTTLREAADELNRYNAEQIVVTDDAAKRVFGGKFRTTDSDRFAEVIGTSLGLQVERRGNEILISGK